MASLVEAKKKTETYENLKEAFVTDVISKFGELSGEIEERNTDIEQLDAYIYGDLLEKSLDIPIGHDKTPVNWLKRTVEIHKNMFMSRGFNVTSTYNSENASNGINEEQQEEIKMTNSKEKDFAEERMRMVQAVIEDNGGNAFFDALAENASAVGNAAIKAYYDDKEDKYVLSEIESIENLYVLWNNNNFRHYDAVAYVWQVSKQKAIRDYNASEDVATSPVGSPMEYITSTDTTSDIMTQPMVTIFEVTGKIEGWASDKGRLKRVSVGKETDLNAIIVGHELKKLRDDPKRLPKYYILPNKRKRRRAWGLSDVSDAAININATYVETLSDWRTHASKVNFQKYKAFGFGPDTTLPKSETRKVQMVPLSEGQDLVRLDQGDSNGQDFLQQMDELKEQFVRETGISRVLFDDPSVTLNSNQALLTSMKPTSDIAEAKKQLWTPILIKMFRDALETIALWNKDVKEIVEEDGWGLKIQWPSIMQKEDPVYQQMLLNRFNAGTMSVQTYLEQQGESKEEIDRLRDELSDPITAAILSRQLGLLAQGIIAPVDPDAAPQPKVNVSLRGDLTPQQEANLADQVGFQDGPFPASMGPQGTQGNIAYQNADNQGFVEGDFPNQTPKTFDQNGQPVGMQKADTNTGQDANAQVTTQANNQEGQGVMSQPGSGATTASPQGAINQTNQQNGA